MIQPLLTRLAASHTVNMLAPNRSLQEPGGLPARQHARPGRVLGGDAPDPGVPGAAPPTGASPRRAASAVQTRAARADDDEPRAPRLPQTLPDGGQGQDRQADG